MEDFVISLRKNRNRITYRSFITEDADINTVASDIVGYGTQVAGLLLRVAPHAHIYVAQISDDKGLPNPEVVEKASCCYLDEWHIHIIGMSFGFNKFTEELGCIRGAILYAHSKETVMFAAARNNGGLQEIAYPASQEEVICISSTDGYGNPSSFNPSFKEGRNFSTVGENVPTSSLQRGQVPTSGTSFATPIAAGIAAFSMGFMEQKREQNGEQWSKNELFNSHTIKTRAGIIAVFERLSDQRADFRFLRPWKLFNLDSTSVDTVLLNALQLYPS